MLRSIRYAIVWLCVVWACLIASPAAAQCPPKTTVADTLYNADGSPTSGRVVVSWPTFLIGACQVIAGQATVVVTNGALSVQLYPNTSAVPSGTSYRVTYALKSGRISTEYWVVPQSAVPVALATVRSATVPVPNVMFSQAQVTNLPADLARKVELPSPCPAGKILQSNGASSPPQVDCLDPSSGSSSQHQVNGVNLVANNPINFQDSSTVSIANPSAGDVQASVKDGSITAAKLGAANPTAGQLSGVGDANISASALSPDRVAGTAVVLSRAINTTSPLSGGGNLSADRTLSCPTCEVNTNKAAASGYASLDASTKVVQNPASAQTSPAASRIPLADGTGKIADGWLSANVSLLGSVVDLGSEVSGALPAASGGTGASNTATSGRFLRGNGTNFLTSSVAAAGAGSCTNQFWRAGNDNAAPTCASVAGSDFAGQSANQIFAGPASGGAAAPGFRDMVKADTPATTVHTDQANTYSAGLQHFGSATLLLPNAAVLPSTCAVGEIYMDNNETPTGQQVYVCSALNTWSKIGDGGAGGSNHNLLSSTHPDTTAGAVARGDLIAGQGASPTWSRLALGTANRVLRSDGTDAAWGQVQDADLVNNYSGVGSCTNQFVRGVNDNSAPTCATVSKADASSTFVHTDQANTWSTGAQDMGSASSLVVPKAASAAPTADGDVRYDTTQDTLVAGGNGAVKGFLPRVLKMTNCTTEGNCTTTNEVDATSGQQGTTETNFASNWSMPANFLFTNKAIRVCATFELTTSASPPTLLLRLKAGSIVLVATTATAPPVSFSGKGFSECWIVQGTAAPGASVSVEANPEGPMVYDSASAYWKLFNTVDQPVTGVATNGALTIQVSGQWGTATAGNTVQMHQFYVMELN